MRHALPLVLALSFGCAGAPPPQAAAPVPSSTVTPAESNAPPDRAAPKTVQPAAVPPPPAECSALVAHPTSGCGSDVPSRAALAAALSKAGPERDAAFACVEANADLPPGLVRALRAELGPVACADALVTPLLESPPKGMNRDLESVMLGLVVSARLSRLLADPPRPEPPVTKERFRAFFAEVLTPWVLSQAAAVEKLSLAGARLSGYGRGVAAIAAGNADLRFVEMVREVPLPDEMKADKAVESAYYAALDEALEPRKARGRDAALVGLRAFAELGAVHDPRVDRARELLTKLYSGSRVDALDRLLLPDLDAPDLTRPELALAALLPTYYANELYPDAEPVDSKLVRAYLARGLPAKLRAKLDAATALGPVRLLHARGLFESGQKYFRARDFQRAASVLENEKEKLDEGGRLLAALAKTLSSGPEDAAALMLKGPFLTGTGDVGTLDAEAKKKGRLAGRVTFDAAYLLQLSPKPDDPAFWDDIAQRFGQAEKLLRAGAKSDAVAAPFARGYADAARATASALRKK
jgi:hypothetical protein